jgi:putative oxidoreductase
MTLNLALAIPRVVIGLMMTAHGLQKLGWLGGHGIAGTSAFLSSLGFRPGRTWTWVLAASETVGGLLMALGLFSPVGPLLVLAGLAVGTIVVHWPKGFWNMNGGIEWPLALMAVALSSAISGPGSLSIDALLGIRLPMEADGALIILIALGVLAAFASRLMPELNIFGGRGRRSTPTQS